MEAEEEKDLRTLKADCQITYCHLLQPNWELETWHSAAVSFFSDLLALQRTWRRDKLQGGKQVDSIPILSLLQYKYTSSVTSRLYPKIMSQEKNA